MANPLVAQAPQEGSGFTKGTGDNGWATGVSIAESAMDTFNGFKDGNWIEGGLGVVGLAADAASMAIDPFGTLMSSAASFLMEHVQPLKDMLDWLAGDPPVIESYSTTWSNVSTELGKISQDYADALASGTEGWTGAAADAYRAAAAQQGDALSGAASASGSVGTVVGIMGMVVAFVREMVRDLIADLVAKLITWVLEAVFSLGFGTPVIVAQAITAISKWAARIAKLVQKLLDTIKKVSPMLKRLVEIFEKIMKVLGKLAGKVTGLDVFGTKFDDPGFLKKLGRDGVDTPSGSHTGSSPSGRSDPDGPSTGTTPNSSPDSTSPSTNTPDSTPASTPTSTNTSASADPPSTRATDGGPPPARGTTGPGDTTPSQTHNTPSSTTPSAHSPAPAPHGPGSTPTGHSPTSSAHSPDSTPSGPASAPGHSPGSTPSGHSPSSSPNSTPGHSPNSPGSTPASHSPAPAPGHSASPNSPGSTPSGQSPTSAPAHSPSSSPGSTPSGHSPTTSPSSGPPRVDQTHSSATATPNAPHRTDQPHTAPPRDPGPSSAPQPSPGAAPHSGGQPGGSPNAGGPPRTGGGWTGTSGHRGDTTSGVPQSRPHETPGGTSRPQSAPPHAAGPPQARPHTGPPQARPQAGPPHQGPPHQGPPRQGPHQNAPHQPQPRGPQSGPPHDRGGVPPQRDPNGAPHRNAPHHDGPSPDGHQPPHAPEPRPNIDEAHARHGETTPAGISHHRGDSDMGDLPSRVPNDPRYFTADVHITPDGRARVGNHTYSPEEYGDLLRRNGWDGKTPIRLIGCDAGGNDFAKRLSAHTDAPVLAPTKPAWTDSKGRVFTSDAEVDAHGNRQPKIPPNGEWETHQPDGTRTKASEDGFVPGTHDKDKTDLDPTDAKDRAAEPDGDAAKPYERDPQFSHHPGSEPPDPARPQVLETLDPKQCRLDDDGLITHYRDQPIDEYVRDVLTDRAKLIQSKIENRSIMPDDIRGDTSRNPEKWAAKNVVCVSVSVDHRTGRVYESINGSATDVIPAGDLHPALRDRQEAMRGNPQPDGTTPGYIQPDRAPDRAGQPMHDRNGNEIRHQFPLNDAPTRHAEVKNVNQMLRDRGVPDDVSPEELDKILAEMKVDNAFTPPGKGPSADGVFPNIAPCCANCTRMIDGVPSSTEKFTEQVGHSDRKIIPPGVRHHAG